MLVVGATILDHKMRGPKVEWDLSIIHQVLLKLSRLCLLRELFSECKKRFRGHEKSIKIDIPW